MSKQRSKGTLLDNAGIRAHIIDAMGGGLCKIHGPYYGHGKYDLKDCPFCDIEEYYQRNTVHSKCSGGRK